MARPQSDIRERLLAAAARRFLDHGVDGAALREVARDAGTSVGMIHYYFPTKEDLFDAVVSDVYARLVAALGNDLGDDAPLATKLERAFVRIGTLPEGELRVLHLILREFLSSPERRARVIAMGGRGHVPLFLRTFIEALTRGEVRRDLHLSAPLIATFAVGMFGQIMRRIIGKDAPIPGLPEGEELARALCAVVLDGIRPRE